MAMVNYTETEKVFKYFRLVEVFLCGVCFVFHVAGFWNRVETVGHTAIACGSFLGLFFLNTIEIVAALMGYPANMKLEVAIATSGSVMMIIAATTTLQVLEKDQHLPYLTNREEPNHEVFYWGIRQVFMTMVAMTVYLAHAILAFDEVLRTTADPEAGHVHQHPGSGELRFFCAEIMEKWRNLWEYCSCKKRSACRKRRNDSDDDESEASE